jgi:hypothetical protein
MLKKDKQTRQSPHFESESYKLLTIKSLGKILANTSL